MRALVLEGDAGIDHLSVVDRPAGEPTPGRVAHRVTMKAASLNYRDPATVGSPMIKARLPLGVPLTRHGCWRSVSAVRARA